MTKILRVAKVITVNLLILFVLLEVGSAGFYYFKTKEFFYTRSKERVATTRAQFETLFQAGAPDSGLTYQLHPYFGFVERGVAYAGLPYKRANKDQFIIGIFGGSVALQYYAYEMENHILARALQRLPQFQNKEIIILRFCHQAYKQPQQLLVLNYFLSLGQEMDMAINIDGFNEVALAYANNQTGIDSSMPVGFLMMPLVNMANKDFHADQLELTLEVLQMRQRLKDALDKLNACKLAVCYSVRWAQTKYLFGQFQSKWAAFSTIRKTGTKNSLVHVNTADKPLGNLEVLDRAVDQWANSSLAMNGVLLAKKTQYFEFIQPNQYHPTNRQFGAEEKKTAFAENSMFGEAISMGYSKLLGRIPSLRDSGVKVFNTVEVFDETKDPVYLDNCCHYNRVGLGVFSDYVARSIVNAQQTNAGIRELR